MGATAGAFGLLLLTVGVWNSALGAGLVGIVGITLGLHLMRERGRLEPGREGEAVTRVAVAIFLVTPFCAVLYPTVGDAVAMSSMMPVVMAIAFVDQGSLRRLMVAGAISGIACSVGSRAATSPSTVLELSTVTGFAALMASYVIVFALLWAVSRRLKEGASDLRSVVAMSGDLTQTLDPQQVGNAIAAHIARAVGAQECGLNYLDEDGDRLVVHGYFPPERAQFVEPSYSASAYPATRQVIADQRPYVAHVDDPTADPQEVAFLRSTGQSSIAIIPLIAAGRTVGIVEFTSVGREPFDARAIELATMLATEAAMALENARLYDQIRHQAFHDGLTGLSNRSLFRDRVKHSLDLAARRSDWLIAVLYIDLDGFKTMNDRLGHAGGDELLAAAAARIASVLRPGDTAARLGGDEFAVLLEGLGEPAQAGLVAQRVIAALAEPTVIGDTTVSIRASVGLDVGSGMTETVDDLLRNADVAMYAAKNAGGARWDAFRPDLREEAATRSQLARQLEGAAERGELRLDFQPIVDLETGRISGVESLVRWQRPDRPLLMPADFIALAEGTGAIHAIGRWVVRESCRNLRDWQVRLGLGELTVSVNLTATQFDDPAIVDVVREALADSGLAAASLTLEITESGLMRNTPVTIARLTELRALGVRVAVDDFGTGYSSLSYLEQFPIDILKIDRSFISGVTPRGERSVVARMIVEVGRTLGLAVVAEGIETEEQADWIRSLGCTFGQGYLFARPLGAAAIEAVLGQAPASRRRSRPAARRRSGAGTRRSRPGSPPLRLISGG